MSSHLDPNVEPEQRIVVVGDLHGLVHKARTLWRCLEETLTSEALSAALVVFLGDYCDRGLYTKELLNWLVMLKAERARRGGRTVCLLGNHEFCVMGFLGLLPKPQAAPDFCFRQTWDREDCGVSRHERDRWWGNDDKDEAALDEVHLQGRRWAGAHYERSYGSSATFASYGADRGDRDALLRAMPPEHTEFLRRCPWIHIEEHTLLGRCIFVHAGLEADGTPDCEEQIGRLLARDARHPQPEPLFGRDSVLHAPPQLTLAGTTVISGHHGRVLLKTHRLVLDSCCGDEHNPLSAMVLPEMLLVRNDGKVEPKDPGHVFPALAKHRRGGGTLSSFLSLGSLPSSPASAAAAEHRAASLWLGNGGVGRGRDDHQPDAAWSLSMPRGDDSPLEE